MTQATSFNPTNCILTTATMNAVEEWNSTGGMQGFILSRAIGFVGGSLGALCDAIMHLALGAGKLAYAATVDNPLSDKKFSSDALEPSMWNSDQGVRHIKKAIGLTGAAVANLTLSINPEKEVAINRQWGVAQNPTLEKGGLRSSLGKVCSLITPGLREVAALFAGLGVVFWPAITGGLLIYSRTAPNYPYDKGINLALGIATGVAQLAWFIPGSMAGYLAVIRIRGYP